MKKQIIEALKNCSSGIGASDLAREIDANYKTIYGNLTSLCELGFVDKVEKEYFVTDVGIAEFCLIPLKQKEKIVVKSVDEIMKQPTNEKPVEVEIKPINEKTIEEINATVNYDATTPSKGEQIIREGFEKMFSATPDYYKGKSMQVFDVLDDFLTPEAVSGFWVGNIIKYVLRYRGKNSKDDLLKARDYLDKLIESID